jgi:hypothetical protein
VANLFTPDAVLLVKEFQRRVVYAFEYVPIIQRGEGGRVVHAIYAEMDVLEEEGLRARFRIGGVSVFCWAEEPEECHNDEVNNVLVEGALPYVVRVEDLRQLPEDGSVDRVGAVGRSVFFPE